MTDVLRITTLVTAISALSITVTKADGTSGAVTVRDLSGLKVAILPETCPVLAPRPDGFLSNFRIERMTYGGDAALKDAGYTLNYIFYYAPIAQGPELLTLYGNMVSAAAVVLNALANNTALSGATDMEPPSSLTRFGLMVDPAGTQFHGFDVALPVMQQLEN